MLCLYSASEGGAGRGRGVKPVYARPVCLLCIVLSTIRKVAFEWLCGAVRCCVPATVCSVEVKLSVFFSLLSLDSAKA